MERKDFLKISGITEAQLVSLMVVNYIRPTRDPINRRADFTEAEIIKAKKAVDVKNKNPEWTWGRATKKANNDLLKEKFDKYNKPRS